MRLIQVSISRVNVKKTGRHAAVCFLCRNTPFFNKSFFYSIDGDYLN